MVRTTRSVITFKNPFVVGSPGTARDRYRDGLPAGSYELVIEEELLPSLSFEAYRRIATYLTIRVRPGTIQMRLVDPGDLEKALRSDQMSEPATTDSNAGLSPLEDLHENS
jgi:hypothetical protein